MIANMAGFAGGTFAFGKMTARDLENTGYFGGLFLLCSANVFSAEAMRPCMACHRSIFLYVSKPKNGAYHTKKKAPSSGAVFI